jgi:hypothetical protein
MRIALVLSIVGMLLFATMAKRNGTDLERAEYELVAAQSYAMAAREVVAAIAADIKENSERQLFVAKQEAEKSTLQPVRIGWITSNGEWAFYEIAANGTVTASIPVDTRLQSLGMLVGNPNVPSLARKTEPW